MNTDDLPRLTIEEDDRLLRVLSEGQRLIARDSRAIRAVTQAFVAEGRRFAATPEGQRWKQRLAQSGLIRTGRLIWRAYGLDAPMDDEPAVTASEWLDEFIGQLAGANLEAILSKLMADSL
jgi:hypothetical protein